MPNRTAAKRDTAHLVLAPLASALLPLTVRSHDSMIRMDQIDSTVAATFNLPEALCALDDILKRIDRSNSWAYENGLVPVFDRRGQKIKNTKTPPWPWEVLPAPIIKVGKKAWLTRDIDHWIARLNMRVNGPESARATDASNEHMEVAA